MTDQPAAKATQQHTPLPWNAATAISSTMGLPIVSQQGRPICNVHSAPIGMPGYAKHNREALANAAFIARACNHHYELLQAVKDTIEREYNAFEPDNQSARHHKLKSLVAKVEERT